MVELKSTKLRRRMLLARCNRGRRRKLDTERARLPASSPVRVRYLGSILMRDDEVVLCRFDGDEEAVRRVAVAAAIPFERILATAESTWPLPAQ